MTPNPKTRPRFASLDPVLPLSLNAWDLLGLDPENNIFYNSDPNHSASGPEVQKISGDVLRGSLVMTSLGLASGVDTVIAGQSAHLQIQSDGSELWMLDPFVLTGNVSTNSKFSSVAIFYNSNASSFWPGSATASDFVAEAQRLNAIYSKVGNVIMIDRKSLDDLRKAASDLAKGTNSLTRVFVIEHGALGRQLFAQSIFPSYLSAKDSFWKSISDALAENGPRLVTLYGCGIGQDGRPYLQEIANTYNLIMRASLGDAVYFDESGLQTDARWITVVPDRRGI